MVGSGPTAREKTRLKGTAVHLHYFRSADSLPRFSLSASITATLCVYKRCESPCARHCAANRYPVAPPSLLDRILGQTRSAFAREGVRFAVRDAAALEPLPNRQTAQPLDEDTARQRHQVHRYARRGSAHSARGLKRERLAGEESLEVPDVHVPSPWRLYWSTVVFLLDR